MRDTYSGLGVTGPLDGKRLDSQTSRVQMEERPPVPLRQPSLGQAAQDLVLKIHTYTHHRISDGFGLWLPEGITPEKAVEHMVEAVGVTALASRYEQVLLRRRDDERTG